MSPLFAKAAFTCEMEGIVERHFSGIHATVPPKRVIPGVRFTRLQNKAIFFCLLGLNSSATPQTLVGWQNTAARSYPASDAIRQLRDIVLENIPASFLHYFHTIRRFAGCVFSLICIL